ncbi:hypothetical protein OC844_004515 [Tilletia horrida]|nr:hypothetical protein OC844_004515 [Tilletia horrida]
MSALTSSVAALAALEQFLLLAKSARGIAAAKLIVQATSAPGCYVFSELLDVDGIKQLAQSPEHAPAYHLLELFAYGTYQDYVAASSPGSSMQLPPLNDAQRSKLQLLTLVTMASRARVLEYDALAAAVGLIAPLSATGTDSSAGPSLTPQNAAAAGPSSSAQGGLRPSVLSETQVRELEDIIIEAIYAGVLNGKLNQKLRRFEVEAALGRDVRGAQELGELAGSLQAWSSSADAVLNQLSQRIVDARASARRATEQKAAHEGEIARVLYQLYDHALGARRQAERQGGRKGDGEDGDAMDVDADGAEMAAMMSAHHGHGRNRKKGASSASLARLKRSRA